MFYIYRETHQQETLQHEALQLKNRPTFEPNLTVVFNKTTMVITLMGQM